MNYFFYVFFDSTNILLQVVLIVGGAQEAFHARPGNYRIVLNKRKGFVKLAIQSGTPIVPVFSFGETEIVDQPNNEPGTKLRAFQDFVKRWTGIAPIFYYARGFSAKSVGMIPHGHPITSVVGAPIHVKKNEAPSNEEIDKVHAQFVEEITKLFEEHKDKYLTFENAKLILD